MLGGSSEQAPFFEDAWALHIPSLTWQGPLTAHGRRARSLLRICGHSAEGLVLFGGVHTTIMGVLPVAKMDVLLLGDHRWGEGLWDEHCGEVLVETSSCWVGLAVQWCKGMST